MFPCRYKEVVGISDINLLDDNEVRDIAVITERAPLLY